MFLLPRCVRTLIDILLLAIRTKDGVEIYPRDQRGEELGKNARIWRIYTDEARKADARMTEGWNRSIDVLLVFVRVPFSLYFPRLSVCC